MPPSASSAFVLKFNMEMGSSDVRWKWKTIPQTSGCARKRPVADSGQTTETTIRQKCRNVGEAERRLENSSELVRTFIGVCSESQTPQLVNKERSFKL